MRIAACLAMLSGWCGMALAADTPAPLRLAQANAAVEIGIDRATDPRTPVAVPVFSAAAGYEEMGSGFAEIVRYDLEFSGLFRILPPDRYPASFTGFTEDFSSIAFSDWADTGIEYLVYAHIRPEGQRVVAECRFFDVIAGQQIAGKEFRADTKWARLVAHQYSDEIVYHVTGERGIASSRIFFAGKQGSAKELYVADYDGANVAKVTDHGSISIRPRVSPDGARLAYLSFKDRYPFLYVLELASGTSAALSKRVGLNAAPGWSPDGNRVAFVLSKDGNPEIYVKEVNGGDERRLTNDRAVDMSPCFSPDGRQIVFVSERAGTPQIYVMNADGSSPRRVSFQGGSSYDPVWSPDGTRIAYVVQEGGFQIYVMNADGSNPRRLTTTGSNESPSWSADSRHLVFTSTRAGTWSLWTVRLDDGREQRIPGIDFQAEGPSWGPRRE